MNCLLSLLERTKSKPLLHSMQRFLRPALLRLEDQSSSRHQTIGNLGLCWIALGELIMDLYIPDIPIDPAAIQRCTTELWRKEEGILCSEIHLHSQYEHWNTGNTNSTLLTYLKTRLSEISQFVATVPILDFLHPRDIPRIHMFWSEVSQFKSQVVSSSRIESLLHLLESGDTTAQLREQAIQQTISAFCQRLDVVYHEHADLNTPLQLSLLHLKLGLRFQAHSALCMSNMPSDAFAMALVTFPSVQSSTLLSSELECSPLSTKATSRYFLLKLAALGFEIHLGVDLESHIHSVHAIFDQILRLWLIEQARKDDLDIASQSLYRHKTLDHDAVSDADVEEREFLALFPQFENILQHEIQPQTKSNRHSLLLIDPSNTQTLVDIHYNLLNISHHHSDLSFSPFVIFHNIRQLELESLLDTQEAPLSDLIDLQSFALQYSLMDEHLSELRGHLKSGQNPYNFYTDANILEVRKAAIIIEELKRRLDTLIQEWPDQMVLQHLKGRCDTLLRLELHSPVAKMLSALEQLLTQSEDWEIYANRENSLKGHQQAIIGLIVDWRRLELSSWQALLQAQALSFSDAASEWWFRLYDAAIKGALEVIHQELNSDRTEDDYTKYLGKLSPLLDDFMRSSPLGQYHTRLQLLQSFSIYTSCLARSESGQKRLSLDRLNRILDATAQYYESFASPISLQFSGLQAQIEKEIQAFIKLASWKDVNVYSLKQSAQKSHRQLYKCIRKFRDAMRQPIIGYLQPEPAGDAETQPFTDSEIKDAIIQPASATPAFPESPAGQLSNHLFRLHQTFQRFDTLINSCIRPSIRFRTAPAVDNLAVEIISTAKMLSTLSIQHDASDKKAKLQKGLLVRKRKAWSDLLKELKRIGLATNMKPDDIRRLRDMRWMREQPIPPKKFNSVEKGEVYLNRLYGALPVLRGLLSDHHPDLSTRELQRGVNLLESGFAMALDARSWYNIPTPPWLVTNTRFSVWQQPSRVSIN